MKPFPARRKPGEFNAKAQRSQVARTIGDDEWLSVVVNDIL